LAKQEEVIQRFEALPGISWIRAATLYAYLDTPWRFRSKAALWKYLGIGLERKHSGNGPEYLGVPTRAHRLLKGTILGAACSAVVSGNNPFAELYGRWIEQGLGEHAILRSFTGLQEVSLHMCDSLTRPATIFSVASTHQTARIGRLVVVLRSILELFQCRLPWIRYKKRVRGLREGMRGALSCCAASSRAISRSH
jgi:hypothetical protein